MLVNWRSSDHSGTTRRTTTGERNATQTAVTAPALTSSISALCEQMQLSIWRSPTSCRRKQVKQVNLCTLSAQPQQQCQELRWSLPDSQGGPGLAGSAGAPAAAARGGAPTLGKGRRHQIPGWSPAHPHWQKCHVRGHQARGTRQHRE